MNEEIMDIDDDNQEEKLKSIGHPVEEEYCTCVDQHIYCPEDIRTARCAYCGKRLFNLV